MNSVAIIGLGNIGLRHLQSVAKGERRYRLFLVEPQADHRHRAEEALREACWSDYSCHASLQELETAPDLAIVATGSKPRADLVTALVDRGVSRLILEKFLFCRRADYERVDALMQSGEVRAWVNCPRRLYPGNQTLLQLLQGKGIRRYEVQGDSWGLACNVIHFLDHLSFLCGDANEPVVSVEGLRPGAISAKRPGYIEFLGTLQARLGDTLFVASCGAGEFDGLTVHITTQDGEELSIDEGARRLEHRGESFDYPVPYQSHLTAGVVDEIMSRDASLLCEYGRSSVLHKAVLDGFLNHLGEGVTECAIT